MPTDSSAIADARLELKAIGELSGRFFVPAYQRGYRWGNTEVDNLLNDIWEFTEQKDIKPDSEPVYCLQPVVVMRRAENEWELVDGQQRLTTLYLVHLYMQRARLRSAAPGYTLVYETRKDSAEYLRDLGDEKRGANIDFFHMHGAYACIRAWFAAQKEPQRAADRLSEQLQKRVKVIWYEAPAGSDATALFTRLNVGRIPLTDAELIKTLLLAQGFKGELERPVEVAAQWDALERELRDPALWAFVTNAKPEAHPTRIELLFELLAGAKPGEKRAPFHTFDALREKVAADREAFWQSVLGLHATIREWYDDRELYHKVGYLIAEGTRLVDLINDAKNTSRSAFRASLDARIRDGIKLTRSQAESLHYDKREEYSKCARLLHLMNVLTVMKLTHSSERYPFDTHKKQPWSLEHIHAQNAEELTKKVQQHRWLTDHRAALGALDPAKTLAVRQSIDDALGAIDALDGQAFAALARDVTDLFTVTSDDGDDAAASLHTLDNLALLPSDVNSALGNSVFEVKRRKILERDREGAYIPICTRRVFLKYFTAADAQQVHFWSPKDRTAWLDAMFSAESGTLFLYLTPEAAQ